MDVAQFTLALIGYALAIVAIVVAVRIARRQTKQLDQLAKIEGETSNTLSEQEKQLVQLHAIESDTRDVARQLRADTAKQDFVTKFFALSENRPTYKCVVPVRYEKRPLPLVPAGDYNALHVFQSLLGPKHIELKSVPMLPSAGGQDGPRERLGENAIYLCSPQRNPELHSLAPEVKIVDEKTPANPMFGQIELPCWFANDYRAASPGGTPPKTPGKKIHVVGNKNPLWSEAAERAYAEAAELDDGVPYQPDGSDIMVDYAILLRLTDGIHKAVAVAGSHQYGTWIASDFFCRLAEDAEAPHRDTYEGDDDFIAILYGEFNPATFSVELSRDEFLWVRRADDSWDRVS